MAEQGTIGVRAVFDDSQVAAGVKRYNTNVKKAEQTTEALAKRTERTAQRHAKAFATMRQATGQFQKTLQTAMTGYGKSLATADQKAKHTREQNVRAFDTMRKSGEQFGTTMQTVIQRYNASLASASQQAEKTAQRTRAALGRPWAGALGARLGAAPAPTAIGDEASLRAERLARRAKEAEAAVAGLNEEQEDTEGSEKQVSALAAQMRMLRTFRWSLVTLIFMARLVSKAVVAAFKRMGEAIEERAMIYGVQALADVYGRSLASIVDSMQDAADGTLNLAKTSKAAQAGLLADQGRFADEYGKLWEAARVAAVVSGADAERVFVSLIKSLEEGDGAIADSVTGLFRVEDALTRYALASGKTADQLSEQQKIQVTLNTVYSQTNDLLESGAAKALETGRSLEELKGRWAELTATLASFAEVTGILEATNKELETSSKLIALFGAGMVGLSLTLEGVKEAIATGDWERLNQLLFVHADASEEVLEIQRQVDEAFRRTAGALVVFEGKTGKASARLDDMNQKMAEARMRAVELIGAGLEQALDLIDRHNRRVARAERDHDRGMERMAWDYNKDIDRINRRALTSRERAIRNANKRIAKLQGENNKRVQQMTEQHQMRMRHAQQRYNLMLLNNEALYLYERGRLVAMGDVLAIEDLDARYVLEREAQERNFQLQKQQAEEMFQLQLKYARMAAREQLQVLRDGLLEQLREIEERRREDIQERKATYADQMTESEAAHRDQLTELEESLQDQLITIGRGMQKQAETWEEGYDVILKLIKDVFGPSGTASSIIDGFLGRYRDITIRMQTYIAEGRWPTGRGSRGGPGGPQRGYQYGGEFMVSQPTSIMVGERGTERVAINPMSSIGGSMAISWQGGPINVHGTGEFSGANMDAIGQQIATGLVLQMQSTIMGYRGQRGR